jgi:endonuclease/exonuclease/phosphatase (EEP) superfamily protein YafD
MDIRNSLTKFAIVNGILITIWFAIWLLFSDGHWLLVTLNRGIHFLFIPSFVLMLLAIVRQRIDVIVITIIPFLIFLYTYGPHYMPTWTGTNPTVDFQVMTFNVLYSNHNYEEMTDFLQEQQPDLVALQEVKPKMFAELTRNLNSIYPFSFISPVNDYGTTAILSRHPIISSKSNITGS